MTKTDQIAADYATNRLQLKNVGKEINQLLDDACCLAADGTSTSQPLDLQGLRKEWLEYHEEDHRHVWPGWVAALNSLDDVTVDQFKLAGFLDRKKEIKRQAGIIKNRLNAAGNKLIKEALK